MCLDGTTAAQIEMMTLTQTEFKVRRTSAGLRMEMMSWSLQIYMLLRIWTIESFAELVQGVPENIRIFLDSFFPFLAFLWATLYFYKSARLGVFNWDTIATRCGFFSPSWGDQNWSFIWIQCPSGISINTVSLRALPTRPWLLQNTNISSHFCVFFYKQIIHLRISHTIRYD